MGPAGVGLAAAGTLGVVGGASLVRHAAERQYKRTHDGKFSKRYVVP